MKKWICSVCAYVHEGDAPPDECPICGAPASAFEPYVEPEVSVPAPVGPAASAPVKKWICTVCGYIHEGDEPPEECPICAAPASAFEPYTEEPSAPPVSVQSAAAAPKPPGLTDPEIAAFSMSYGLYIISTQYEGKKNGQIANTAFQLTVAPLQVAICLNKDNYTHELVTKSKVFSINTLGKSGFSLVPGFGFRSGREHDKFAGVDYETAPITGCPIPMPAVAYLECRVKDQGILDVGTHTVFVGEVVGGKTLRDEPPMTYAEYRQIKAAGGK